MFANDPGDVGSIPGPVLPKTQKMVLDAVLLCSQHYKVRIKSKVKQSREWHRVLPYLNLGVEAIGKRAFGSPPIMFSNFTFILRLNSGVLSFDLALWC